MSILDDIISYKKEEVREKQRLFPMEYLKKGAFYSLPCVSLKQQIQRKDKPGIIAEFKRRSPSKGVINNYAEVEQTTVGYMQAGASALSVLTDSHFFGGGNNDLEIARKFNSCPVLRKDFIIDEYQLFEAKSIGADAVLLLASVLSKEEIGRFTQIVHELGMEVLLEFYGEEELDKYGEEVDLVGINNRNLKTFAVDFEHAIKMAEKLPAAAIKIAESGIQHAEDILLLKKSGFDGFLIGELFMWESSPEKVCKKFIQDVNALPKTKRL